MRRPVGLFLIASCALIAAAAAACGSTEPLPSGVPNAASGQPPLASTSGTTTTSGLSDFEARVRDATAREGALVRDLGTASAGSAADLRLVLEKMRQWAEGERTWLAQHPPDPCYDAAATKLQAAAEAISSSAAWFSGMIAASISPSDDVSRGSMGTEAANDLQDATQALADAAALAKTARAACR
jgi:hypothetical protein